MAKEIIREDLAKAEQKVDEAISPKAGKQKKTARFAFAGDGDEAEDKVRVEYAPTPVIEVPVRLPKKKEDKKRDESQGT